MAVIKGSIEYIGNLTNSLLKEVVLEFSLPRFKYIGEIKSKDQVEQEPVIKQFSHSLLDKKYAIVYPGEYVVSGDLESFLTWAKKTWEPPVFVDDFKLNIPYIFLGPDQINLGQGHITTYFYFDYTLGENASNEDRRIHILNLAKKLFIINAEALSLLLSEIDGELPTNTGMPNEIILLTLISEIGYLTDDRVERLASTHEDLEEIVEKWQKLGVKISLATMKAISAKFDSLTSFPIDIGPLTELKPAGTFQVVTAQSAYSPSELSYYRIRAEARIRTGTDSTRYRTWNVDWGDVASDPISAPLPFKLTSDRPIIASSVDGLILVRVIGFDGTTLWSRSYEPGSDALENIEIIVDAYLPVRLESVKPGGPATLRRIRGQVLAPERSQSVRGLTVVLQAKETEDALWRVVSAAVTGNSGHFSLKYPKGKFVAAQALVSVSPDSAVDIYIVDTGVQDETISDSFLYLLIDTKSLPESTNCPNGSVSRLPDHADLIGSNEYSQDLGGQCVNVTSPNRRLREYSYNAIVRISDPDVSNYTLEKTPEGFKLSGGKQKIKRAAIDLSNPVRWQDAPEAGGKLSFYQSVTVAKGHILFFKSVFKADGYSMGDLIYSLPLAPGQKKQIVTYDVANTLEASESQRLAQGERLAAELIDDRIITDELSGGISETLSGESSARTAGFSAGLGLGISMGKVGGSLGVAGGYSNSQSSASQSGARDISQSFAEKLRQALMQNAESYRELNASVVTTVKEGQEYAVTTEVVANHNHCHSVTMMFFEVLRHYAITQELTDVQECLFVPLLLTEFTEDNISKWKDILATNLLPIPSNTYLQPPWFAKYVKRHPLAKAFDANERIKTDYTRVDYPEGMYAEDAITSISGEIRLRTRLPRPKTAFDRIMSLPVISKTVEAGVDRERSLLSHAPGGERPGIYYKTEEVQERVNISNEFMQLDGNYQNVPPAQAIRIITFSPQTVTLDDGSMGEVDGFDNNDIDKQQWEAYANILTEFGDVYEMMNEFFAGRLVSEFDRIFYQDIAPLVFNRIVDSIKIGAPPGEDAPNLEDLTPMTRYTGGEQSMRIRVAGNYSGTRMDLSQSTMNLHSNSETVRQLHSFSFTTLIVENVRIQYTTAHFNGYIYNGYVGNDLLDGADLLTPLTERDKRNPRLEDEYLVEELFQHLNSNLEHYNKVLWQNLDPDRRYMLLDGFSIDVFDRSGNPIGDRSLASVVKNDLITIVGNALVFPVADGYSVGTAQIIEDSNSEEVQPSLLDHYRPDREIEPYRLSVPTRGVYMESVMGQCDSCEDVKENSSQDWDRFRTEEPTAISPVVTPTPTRTDWRAIWAQFAQPLIALQTSREAPAPGEGLKGLSETLAKADAFRDITGLAGTQENVIRTYLSNQENARAFAEMAKTMAMQEHNSENSRSIMQSLDNAREQGAISERDYSELVRDHLGQQIDGGARRQAEERRESCLEPSLTNAAIDAVGQGRHVSAQRTHHDGTAEAVQVGAGESQVLEPIFYDVPLIPQPNKASCWAAAMAMIESYRRSREIPTRPPLTAADLAEEVVLNLDQIYRWSQLEAAKDHFNFEEIPITGTHYPTAEKWRVWLQEYGPLYVTIEGSPSHAIIMRGISGSLTATGSQLDILNPWDINETFDDDPLEFNPPNQGAHMTMTVEELNERFNGGDLRHLAVYDDWRVLYQPALRWSSVAPTGEQSRARRWIEGVPPDMAAFKREIVSRAINEYRDWHTNSGGRSNWAWWESDNERFVINRLSDYWRATGLNPGGVEARVATANARSRWAWSAAFISHIFKESGIRSNDVWPLSGRHYDYIRHAIHNTENYHRENTEQTPFHGYLAFDPQLEVGDLVGRCSLYDPSRPRENADGITRNELYDHEYTEADFNENLSTVINYYDVDNALSTSSHIDIVVYVADDYLLAIGGNVELERRLINERRLHSSGIMVPQPHRDVGTGAERVEAVNNVSAGIRKIYLDANGRIDPTRRWQILDFPPAAAGDLADTSDASAISWAQWENPALVMWDGPQTEYFVVICVHTDPNDTFGYPPY